MVHKTSLTLIHSLLASETALLTRSLQELCMMWVTVISDVISLLLLFSGTFWVFFRSLRSWAWASAKADCTSVISPSLICRLFSACWLLHSSSLDLSVSCSFASICRSSSFLWRSASILTCSSFLCCSCSLLWYSCSLQTFNTEISCCLSLFHTARAAESSAFSRAACSAFTCSNWLWRDATSSCSSSNLWCSTLLLCFLSHCSSASLRACAIWNNYRMMHDLHRKSEGGEVFFLFV